MELSRFKEVLVGGVSVEDPDILVGEECFEIFIGRGSKGGHGVIPVYLILDVRWALDDEILARDVYRRLSTSVSDAIVAPVGLVSVVETAGDEDKNKSREE